MRLRDLSVPLLHSGVWTLGFGLGGGKAFPQDNRSRKDRAQGPGSALYEADATSLLCRSSRLGTYHQFLFQIQARGWDSRAERT